MCPAAAAIAAAALTATSVAAAAATHDKPVATLRAEGGAERRRGNCAGPSPTSPGPSPHPPTPPSSALCAIAHLVLQARVVGPRLEQRLDAGRVTVERRPMQRRPLVHLPKRGGGPTHAGEWRRRAGGWRVPEVDATPQPTPLNTLACDLEDGTHTVLGMATSHDPPETASRVTGPECTGGRLGVFVASCEGELLFYAYYVLPLAAFNTHKRCCIVV